MKKTKNLSIVGIPWGQQSHMAQQTMATTTKITQLDDDNNDKQTRRLSPEINPNAIRVAPSQLQWLTWKATTTTR